MKTEVILLTQHERRKGRDGKFSGGGNKRDV
jgi:hypothetical protein